MYVLTTGLPGSTAINTQNVPITPRTTAGQSVMRKLHEMKKLSISFGAAPILRPNQRKKNTGNDHCRQFNAQCPPCASCAPLCYRFPGDPATCWNRNRCKSVVGWAADSSVKCASPTAARQEVGVPGGHCRTHRLSNEFFLDASVRIGCQSPNSIQVPLAHLVQHGLAHR